MTRTELDEYVDALYWDLAAELGTELDLEYAVASLYEHGEPEGAILHGFVEAASTGITVSASLLDRAAVIFPRGEDHETLVWAVSVFAGLGR